MKKIINVIVSISLLSVVFCVFKVFADESETVKCKKLIESYGWRISEKHTESVEITIPEIFDEVYKGYNAIQKEAGLDIEPYCGMSGRRYTYEVLNYPFDVGEKVYANVVCIKGEAVAGDIMTVSVNGFMHSLKMPN